MKKRFISFGIVMLIVVVGLWGWYSFFATTPKSVKLAAHVSSVAARPPAVPPLSPDQQTAANRLKQVFQSIFNEEHGFHVLPPLAKSLKAAVDGGDQTTIHRDFMNAIYSPGANMNEAIPALQSFLNDPNPFVRYMAGQDLLTVGDHSGYEPLVDLVQSDTPAMAQGLDVRIRAAIALAQYRETDAGQIIYQLNKSTAGAGLVSALMKLGVNIKPEIQSKGFISQDSAMKYYVLNDIKEFIPQITTVYQHSTMPQAKAAAAWALAMLTNDQEAIDYVIQEAQIVATQGEKKDNPGAIALEYAGTLQISEAKQVLESALNSRNQRITEVAVVNLIFNQGGSATANEFVAHVIAADGTHNDAIPVDLAYEIAAHVNDPQIQAALHQLQFDSGDPTGWAMYESRKNWPIYSWIDDYVIKLNNPPPGP